MTDKQNEVGLLPCAHCGSKARYETQASVLYAVACDGKGCGAMTGWFDTPAEARAAWNRRAGEMAEWTEEVPTEVGIYVVTYSGFTALSFVFFKMNSNRELHITIRGLRDYFARSLEKFIEMYPDAQFLRIPTPPLTGYWAKTRLKS